MGPKEQKKGNFELRILIFGDLISYPKKLSKEKLFSKQREADKLGSRQNLFVSFRARWTLNDIFK